MSSFFLSVFAFIYFIKIFLFGKKIDFEETKT
jgi:hypothetical protein